VFYAPYMEFGTGFYVGRPRHCPPGSALDRWAKRHGISSGYAVASMICYRGGLAPREYLKKGLEENVQRIAALFDKAIQDAMASGYVPF
jgi:hypothetical protein